MLKKIKKELNSLASKKDAEILQRFFKTGKGEYGEGDVFLGIRVPIQRQVVKKYWEMDLKDVESLLKINIHEYRLVALLILVKKFEQGDDRIKKKVFNLYLKNTKYINNWDLVDLTAPNIVGKYLLDKPRDILYKLAKSKSLWERRIAMLACFTFIRNQETKDTLKIAQILLKDEHDLIHKAVGWMLRELGKRVDQDIEEIFLKRYYKSMPRIMLRYSIERFEESKRKKYLMNKI
jgi:3-methyladenine DNA glycosylase AlkD